MVGTGAAALTGLVFVAMSLNVGAIKGDTAHRYRASGSLTGLASVFMLSGLVLMGGQQYQAAGAEVLIVAAGTAAFFAWRFLRTRRFRGDDTALSVYPSLGSTICNLVEMAGATLLIGGDSFGLYLIAVGIMVNFYFMISGAWLLFVGAEGPDQPRTPPPPEAAAEMTHQDHGSCQPAPSRGPVPNSHADPSLARARRQQP